MALFELSLSTLIRTRNAHYISGQNGTVAYHIHIVMCIHIHPIYHVRPPFSLSLLVVPQIWGHIAGSSPPSPLRFKPFIFIARRLQPFPPSSTRVELCLPTLGALSSLSFFFHIFQTDSKPHHCGIRTPGPTLEAVEGNHQTTGATDRLCIPH